MEMYGGYASWVIFGLLAGAIAKIAMPGRDSRGLISTTVLGIAGAVLGNVVYSMVTGEAGPELGAFTLSGLAIASVGGLALLLGYRLTFGWSHE